MKKIHVEVLKCVHTRIQKKTKHCTKLNMDISRNNGRCTKIIDLIRPLQALLQPLFTNYSPLSNRENVLDVVVKNNA